MLFLNRNSWTTTEGVMLAIDIASSKRFFLMYTRSIIPGEICYKVCQLAMNDSCLADSPENLMSLLQRSSGMVTMLDMGAEPSKLR